MNCLSRLTLFLAGAACSLPIESPAAPYMPTYDHVVVVIMSNKGYTDVVGSLSAPYINGTLILNGASFSNSYAVADIEQQNYWALFFRLDPDRRGVHQLPECFFGQQPGATTDRRRTHLRSVLRRSRNDRRNKLRLRALYA